MDSSIHKLYDWIGIPKLDDIEGRVILLNPENVFQRNPEDITEDYPDHPSVGDDGNRSPL